MGPRRGHRNDKLAEERAEGGSPPVTRPSTPCKSRGRHRETLVRSCSELPWGRVEGSRAGVMLPRSMPQAPAAWANPRDAACWPWPWGWHQGPTAGTAAPEAWSVPAPPSPFTRNTCRHRSFQSPLQDKGQVPEVNVAELQRCWNNFSFIYEKMRASCVLGCPTA